MKQFSFFPHTADIGMKVSAGTLKEVFINAASGLAQLSGPQGERGKPFKFNIKLKADGPEGLLISFLNELNYISVMKKALLGKIKITSMGKTFLKAEVSGLKNVEKLSFLREIKAATYHDILIKKTRTGLSAKITFDV